MGVISSGYQTQETGRTSLLETSLANKEATDMPAYASIYTNSICFAASFNTLQLNIRSLALAFSAALLFLGVEDSQELGLAFPVDLFIA